MDTRRLPCLSLLSLLFVPTLANSGVVNIDSPQQSRFRISNQCDKTLWVQQDYKHPTNDPIVVKIEPNKAYDYAIPDKGLASTRFWPKTDCNTHGYQCLVGESTAVPQAITNGWQKPPFAPDINSKFEATWGCLAAIFNNNPSLCASNPSSPGNPLGSETWWNGSAVDGYTLPYRVKVTNHHNSCLDLHSEKVLTSPGVNCGKLSPSHCPSQANLSSEGRYSQINGYDVTRINLQWKNVQTGQPIGCFSPCAKLTTAQGSDNGSQAGGWKHLLGNLTPESPQAQAYCCPTPPVTPGQCSAGPAARSAYAQSVSVSQQCNAYTYAYDDAKGLARCGGQTQFEVIFCPKNTANETTNSSHNEQNSNNEQQSTLGYSMQFNFNPAFGITAIINQQQVANAELIPANQHPSNSILKAIQGNKSANCQLTLTESTITKGEDELCLRLNIVKESNEKIHVYLPADIPDMGTAVISQQKSIQFGMPSDMRVTLANQTYVNGDKLHLTDLPANSILTLTAHLANQTASCSIKQENKQLSLVNGSGNLCHQGLVLLAKDNGDYYLGLPSKLTESSPNSQGSPINLGIAAGMQVKLNQQVIAWNSAQKTLYFPQGTNQLQLVGNNQQTRTCPVTNQQGQLSWPQVSACQGIVQHGNVLYFPAF